MLLQNTNASVNGNLFLNKNEAHLGGALSITKGKFVIHGNTLFDSNSALIGGALHISSHVSFK